MELVKYDSFQISINYNRNYVQRIGSKPVGFWFTLDHKDDWKSFCESNDFWIDKLKVKNIFNLQSNNNVLIINTLDEFDNFTKEFICDNDRNSYNINWIKLAEMYDGIIITDYFWERRLHNSSNWYYGWDCVSGCIWNLNAIKEIN